ncbi:hypothetical protein CCH79_00018447 [Gambusia affinis]|uniref:G protein gamma domain-containing protein n=1 Tax=Gambusia affinis TaxID=33528 RepID=A0A315VDI8_GAMAF|nr:hypothetical protein CCH79_00018447 [Gambusia affinis]
MAELDVPQMKREVESLQYQLAINREKSSITVTELVKWIEGCVCEDPFLNPELMRANPWVEKGKCVKSPGTRVGPAAQLQAQLPSDKILQASAQF